MISEILSIIVNLSSLSLQVSSLLQNAFFLINDDKYNDFKKMFGWRNVNYLLFLIMVIFILLSFNCIWKMFKFITWVLSIILLLCIIYHML